jgi:hypothetical protein
MCGIRLHELQIKSPPSSAEFSGGTPIPDTLRHSEYIYLDQLSLKSQRPTCTDEAAGRKQAELEKERQADTARTDLRDIDFATNLNGPISGTSSAPFARNELEADMWRNYSTM